MCVPRIVHTYAMMHSSERHDWFISVPWIIHMCAMIHLSVCPDSFIYAPRLIHLRASTHSSVWHNSFTHMPRSIYLRAMTSSFLCHDSYICVPWLIHTQPISGETHQNHKSLRVGRGGGFTMRHEVPLRSCKVQRRGRVGGGTLFSCHVSCLNESCHAYKFGG